MPRTGLASLDFDEEIESILFVCREVNVYKIPPRASNEGCRAQDWGDLAEPLWKGRMRIIEKSSGVTINLEDGTTGEIFALAPYGKAVVEAVLDSSRYFVLRVEDNGRKAYIGIGFAERTESFDFNVALQDYDKRQRALLAGPTADADKPSPHIPAGPKKDFSLKEGQTFTISIPGKSGGILGANKASSNNSSSSDISGGAFPLLPPPPSAPKRQR